MTGRVLVTGAGGFIGRHLVERLLDDGKPLALLVRSPASCPAAWLGDSRINILQIPELEDAAGFAAALAGMSSVVHLAGLAHVRQADSSGADDAFMRSNAELTKALAEAAPGGLGAFIHMSSLATVTANATDEVVDDGAPPRPATPYGRSKRRAEEHVEALAGRGVFAVSLRPPLVVGAQARGNWALLQKLAASGLPLPFASVVNERSFVGVDTLCDAVARLVAERRDPGLSGNYCVADEERLSLPDTVRTLRDGMGLRPRLFAFPPAAFELLGRLTGRRRQLAGLTGSLRVDASRFFSSFGFRPAKPIREAVRAAGAAYAAGR